MGGIVPMGLVLMLILTKTLYYNFNFFGKILFFVNVFAIFKLYKYKGGNIRWSFVKPLNLYEERAFLVGMISQWLWAFLLPQLTIWKVTKLTSKFAIPN